MILTIDAGNSRIKWALWQKGLIADRGGEAYDSALVSPVLQEILVGMDRPSAVYAVCVAGETVSRAISVQIKQQWRLPVAFLQTRKSYRHIRNAYAEPSRHGADRWAAVVAAHLMYPDSNLCIIGAGTAITFDFIDAGGRHRGGYILPSWRSMKQALTADTANVVSQPEKDCETGAKVQRLPVDTCDAVHAGLHLLLQAGIREICRRGLAETGVMFNSGGGQTEKAAMTEKVTTKIIISGGFAPDILGYPDMPEMIYQPDLVMQGLYQIMMHPSDDTTKAGV